MNDKQRFLVVGAAILVLLTLIFPPYVVHLPNGAVINMGYDFLFSPPSRGYLSATVNIPTLLAQWAGIAILAGAGWVLLSDGNAISGANPFDSTASSKINSMGVPARILRAGFWRRVTAYLLDYLLLMAGLFILFVILGAIGAVTPEKAEGLGTLMGIMGFWLYFSFSESGLRQATLGKRALGIKVVGLDGRRISFGRASGRHFGKILSGITLGIGFLMCIFTARRQCLHDMLADCVVVKKDATEQEVAVALGHVAP